MARTYRYRWEGGNRMIVSEYENGRYQHEYHGYVRDNGYSVDIYPIKGRRSDGEIPYVARRIRAADLIREEPREAVTPAPSAPVEEYDPTAWHRRDGEQMEGVQLTIRGLEGL